MATDKETETPPAGAGLLRVMVQEVLVLETTVEAAHCRDEIRTAAVREILNGVEEPFSVALIVAVRSEGMETEEAVKPAVVALAGTGTDAGIEKTLAMAPDKEMGTPKVGAGLLRVTVQAVPALEARVAAAHCSEKTVGNASSEGATLLGEPFREAVTVEF
jgi:hypothetical protein